MRDKIIEVVGKEVDIIMDFGIYANLKRKVKTGDDGEWNGIEIINNEG